MGAFVREVDEYVLRYSLQYIRYPLVPPQKCTLLLPHQNYISGLLTQKSGFYSKAKKALAQMKYKPLESTAEACLKRKQAKSDNLAAE
ncbi:hypothetical protein POTOM_009237 [Populus tomentosa]|uniref:Uncharacterized protein n=1 Tax=Populus tomentosa TaxID=118781 RepID=A0A8X8AB32_POPTO|nr:hypothetical protein POTOM_009237 [Populus tomentosa]